MDYDFISNQPPVSPPERKFDRKPEPCAES